MRELKFKLIKDKKIVGFERHVKSKETGNILIFQSEDNEKWINYVARQIPHDFKDQYVFVFRGQDIYGGDVLESEEKRFLIYRLDTRLEVRAKIYLQMQSKWIHCDGCGIDELLINTKLNLIGNKWDNPELVK